MNFSFGIITKKNNEYLTNLIDSIKNLNIPNYEIIVVGEPPSEQYQESIIHIPYTDENPLGDISKKKNLITKNSSYENIVYMHDYIYLNTDWYSGYKNYGNDFDICMNKILNKDGTRYRDWTLWCDDADKYVSQFNYLIPYEMTHLSKMMYISGAYWVAKKDFMIKFPLNEKLSWNQGEDVEWSIRSRSVTDFKFNPHSTVSLQKYKDRIFNCVNENEIKSLNNISYYDDSNSYNILIKNHLRQWI